MAVPYGFARKVLFLVGYYIPLIRWQKMTRETTRGTRHQSRPLVLSLIHLDSSIQVCLTIRYPQFQGNTIIFIHIPRFNFIAIVAGIASFCS